MVPRATAVVDLQFGSTGKGSLAAYLGLTGRYDAVATNWSPNAGHTAVYPDGEKVVRTMLANSVHRGSVSRVFMGPGSVINIDSLRDEFCATAATGKSFVVDIHEHAAIVRPEDREAEAVHNRIGSTQKGSSEAVLRKMRRNPDDPGTLAKAWADDLRSIADAFPYTEINVLTHAAYMQELASRERILLEGCQGYSLGLNSGFWPYVTSRECTVAQLCADTLVPPGWLHQVWGTARTFPIRVANRFNGAGEQVGYSGPGYFDQRELDWDKDLGRPPELTTVTKLPRRIFSFSHEQFRLAIIANDCRAVFMNFMNYLTLDQRVRFLREAEKTAEQGGAEIHLLGFGPMTSDILSYDEAGALL